MLDPAQKGEVAMSEVDIARYKARFKMYEQIKEVNT